MISRQEVEQFIQRRAKSSSTFKTSFRGKTFWYVGRGKYLHDLTKQKNCPFRITNTGIVNWLFRRRLFNLQDELHINRRALWNKLLTNQKLFLLSEPINQEVMRHLSLYKGEFSPLPATHSLMTDVCANALLGLTSSRGKKFFAYVYNVFQRAIDISDAGRNFGEQVALCGGTAAATILRALSSVQSWRFQVRPLTSTTNLLALLEEQGHLFPRSAINDDLLAMLVATRDTTSSALIWMILELADREDIQESLWAECVKAFPSPRYSLSMSHLHSLTRCKSFLFEVLRLHSPNIFAMKEAITQVTLGEHHLQPKDACAYSPLFENFDEELFPNPFEFDPERFLNSSKTASVLSFGIGAHSCIGKNLAQLILMIVLTQMVLRFRLSNPISGWRDYYYSSLGKLPLQKVSLCLTAR